MTRSAEFANGPGLVTSADFWNGDGTSSTRMHRCQEYRESLLVEVVDNAEWSEKRY